MHDFWKKRLLGMLAHKTCLQRESTANIKEAPKAYEQAEPAKPKNILEFDCRGLEFTDFKPEVRTSRPCRCFRGMT